MNNTQSPKCPHVFLYLRAPFCYLVRSFGHLSSPSVSDSPSTKASEQIKPTAFSVSTNKLTKRGNASRRKKIRKQKKNIENYIYIYIRIYKNHVPKFPYVPVLSQNTRSFTWKLERESFLCDRKSVLDNPSDSYASLQMRNAGFYPYSFFFFYFLSFNAMRLVEKWHSLAKQQPFGRSRRNSFNKHSTVN